MFSLKNFTNHLAGMVRQNLPIVQGVEMLAEDAQGKPREMLHALRDHLYEGFSLSEAMYLLPRYFPEDYVSMVRAGERSGNLSEVLEELRESPQDIFHILRKMILNPLFYPLLYWCQLALLITGISFAIIPTFNRIYSEFQTEGFEISRSGIFSPKVQSIVVRSAYLLGFISALFILYVLVWFLLRFFSRPVQIFFKKSLNTFKLLIPLGRRMEKELSLWRFATVSSLCLRAGISLPETLRECSEMSSDIIFRRKLLRLVNLVKEGTSFSGALRKVGGFPHLFIREVAAAEVSGDLPQALARLAHESREKATHYLRLLDSVIVPVITLIFGALVFYMGAWLIYNLSCLYVAYLVEL
jgi:type IV pilus assembly protein PilC